MFKGDRPVDVEKFKEELAALINRHAVDSFCGLPDIICADYVWGALGHLGFTVEAAKRFDAEKDHD